MSSKNRCWYQAEYSSPVGTLTLLASDSALKAILWEDDDPARVRRCAEITPAPENHPILSATLKLLTAYFRGEKIQVDVPMEPEGTEFQKRVWKGLCRIPFGKTRSYRELAAALGNPKSCRAVGAANGRNPISLLIPCHRVIGADGRLTGFAGGMAAKTWLLEHERKSLSN